MINRAPVVWTGNRIECAWRCHRGLPPTSLTIRLNSWYYLVSRAVLWVRVSYFEILLQIVLGLKRIFDLRVPKLTNCIVEAVTQDPSTNRMGGKSERPISIGDWQ